ncbi:MAG: HypC/HybG/HupF family hydrogenase formation chaperone [Propionibacteriaceae bacterium]|nr:HypC/HybG/HupF family hydrogenase formation chaperone [Propionibacteriaceae bacterium]
MCVAKPVRIVEIGDGPMRMGLVEGSAASYCFAYVPDAQVGDFVIVANGFAIEQLDEESAALSLAAFAELEA